MKFIPQKQNYQDIIKTYQFCLKNFPHAKFTICGCQFFGEAIKNYDFIGVTYKDVGKVLEEVYDFIESTECLTVPLYRFPLCQLDPYYWKCCIRTMFKEHMIGPDYTDVNTPQENRATYKNPNKCENCINISTCDWYPLKYIEKFGEANLIKY